LTESSQPLVRSIFHPSDFSMASETAFCHALAIALGPATRLKLLHAGKEQPSEQVWTAFPPVRSTLERWGFLEEWSPRSAVFEELALRVEKVVLQTGKPLEAMLEYLAKKPTDLIVLGTRGLDGLPRFMEGSVSEPLARRSKTMTLFVRGGARGFVSLSDGKLSMRRILVPVDHQPNPYAAVFFATRAAGMVPDETTEITLLNVGSSDNVPAIDLPEGPGWSWRTLSRKGDVAEEILAVAEETSADLIAMVTEGHRGILDALRGSTTEQVVRRAPCPVLAVPTRWTEEIARWKVRGGWD